MKIGPRELDRALAAAASSCPSPAEGIHGPGSLSWRLGRETLNFVGAGRAALLQLSHPAVAYAIDQHSATRRDTRGRFQRTFNNVYSMVFGDWPSAEKSARRVHRIHERVVGTIGEDAGRYPAGSAYAANESGYLTWVWATLVDTVLTVHSLHGGGLSVVEKRRYLRESVAFAGLFGLAPEDLPATHADFKCYFNQMVAGNSLAVTRPAREVAGFLFQPSSPTLAPVMRWYRAATATMMPTHLARAFGLDYSRAELKAASAVLRAVTRAYRGLPGPARYVPQFVAATARLGGKPSASSELLMWRVIEALVRRAG